MVTALADVVAAADAGQRAVLISAGLEILQAREDHVDRDTLDQFLLTKPTEWISEPMMSL